MAKTRDASAIAQLALRVGLLTDTQVQDCWLELGEAAKREPADVLLRHLERKAILTSWQTSKLSKGESTGYILGGYRLLYRIAAGSFGRVFRADNPKTGEIVAVKVLRKRWSDDPHKVELFEREGKVGLSLRHPNIVQILAVNRDPATGQYYIVMEFVEGGNLRDFLAIRKKLEPAEGLRLLKEAVAGLASAFSRGLTHRDIKPTNILISSTGTAKMVDFGLAEIAGNDEDDDETEVDRTVDYAGLEKATGVKSGDTRSDIFFLGCVFYEMLTGKPPLPPTKDRNVRMSRERFARIPPLPPSEVKGPPSLFALVDKMLALDPSARYQSPAQLLEAVQAVEAEVNGETVAPTVNGSATISGQRTVFLVEHHRKLRQVIETKLTEMGYRVTVSDDVIEAVRQFRLMPYQAIVIDLGTTGRDGVFGCERILDEAKSRGIRCAGLLLLEEDELQWTERLKSRSDAALLVRPVTIKQLQAKLHEMLPEETVTSK